MEEDNLEILEEEILYDEEEAREEDLQKAMRLISEIKDKALEDRGLPFEQKYVEALALIKIENQPEFERIKGHWYGKISWKDLNKKIKIGELKIRLERMADDCGGACGICSSSK
jgi:hypothetical protein